VQYIIEFDSVLKKLIVTCKNKIGTLIWKISGADPAALDTSGNVGSSELFFLAGYCATKTELPKHENMWVLDDIDWAAAITTASSLDMKNPSNFMDDEVTPFNLY
jgi:hypothetical protein